MVKWLPALPAGAEREYERDGEHGTILIVFLFMTRGSLSCLNFAADGAEAEPVKHLE